MTGDMTLSIVLGSTMSGVVRAGERVFGAIPLGRERDWEKGYLTEGKAWRLRMIRQSPECCKPCPCVVLGSTDPTPSLGNLIFQALIYMLMIQKFLCPTLTSLLNDMSKCLLFILDFTSKSTRLKIELIPFPPNVPSLSYSWWLCRCPRYKCSRLRSPRVLRLHLLKVSWRHHLLSPLRLPQFKPSISWTIANVF